MLALPVSSTEMSIENLIELVDHFILFPDEYDELAYERTKYTVNE